jgi:hypothetical protein
MLNRLLIAIITTLIGGIVMVGCSGDENIPFRAMDRSLIVEEIKESIPIGSEKSFVIGRLYELYGVEKDSLEVMDYSEHPLERIVNGDTVYATEIYECELWTSGKRMRMGKPYAVWGFFEFSESGHLVNVRAQIHYGDSF